MMFGDCTAIRGHLGAFVDGELPGAEMLRLQEHLDGCPSCSAAAEDINSLGDVLRNGLKAEQVPAMSGLASGVVSRVRAEQSASWRALFERAIDDWHWAIVGFGSVTATSLTTVLVAAVLWFGPAPGRTDSLAAMLSELNASDTAFLVRHVDENWDQMAWRVADGARPQLGSSDAVVRAAFFAGMSEMDLVSALADAVTRQGRLIDLRSMQESDRLYAEWLLEQLKDSFTTPTEVRLITSTTVSAKGL
jgi:anti-sigma factor RsiW